MTFLIRNRRQFYVPLWYDFLKKIDIGRPLEYKNLCVVKHKKIYVWNSEPTPFFRRMKSRSLTDKYIG